MVRVFELYKNDLGGGDLASAVSVLGLSTLILEILENILL